MDLGNFESVRAFAGTWGSRPLHVLLNNAGIMALPNHTLTENGQEKQMQVNHFGHFLLTGLLLPALQASAPSRVVAVSSRASERQVVAQPIIDFDDLAWTKRDYAPL